MGKKILIFWANNVWFGKRQRIIIPNTILVLTTILKQSGYSPMLLDANANNYTIEQCEEIVRELDPDVVLVTGLAFEYWKHYYEAMDICKRVNPDIITICGGVFPTTMPDETLECKSCDYIYVGPAEDRLPGVLAALFDNRIDDLKSTPGIGYRNELGMPVVNEYSVADAHASLKIATEPDYSLVDLSKYLVSYPEEHSTNYKEPTAVIITSYGCLFNCVFCAARTIRGRNFCYRTAENVLDEVSWFYHEHNIRHFTFLDELFLGDKARVYDILNGILERKLEIKWKLAGAALWQLDEDLLRLIRKTGCTTINISVESGSERVIKEIIHKPINFDKVIEVTNLCDELGIFVSANFILGFPGETWEEIRQTIAFAESLKIVMAVFHIATPMPKTDLYRICVEKNLLVEGFDFRSPDFYTTSRGFITSDEFTPGELNILRSFEWDRVNFSTPERTRRFAEMVNLSVEELNKHRRKSRRELGATYIGSPEKKALAGNC